MRGVRIACILVCKERAAANVAMDVRVWHVEADERDVRCEEEESEEERDAL